MGTCFGATVLSGWYPVVMGAVLLRVKHRGFEEDFEPIWLADLGVTLVYGTPYETSIDVGRIRVMSLLLNLVGMNKVWLSLSYQE